MDNLKPSLLHDSRGAQHIFIYTTIYLQKHDNQMPAEERQVRQLARVIRITLVLKIYRPVNLTECTPTFQAVYTGSAFTGTGCCNADAAFTGTGVNIIITTHGRPYLGSAIGTN